MKGRCQLLVKECRLSTGKPLIVQSIPLEEQYLRHDVHERKQDGAKNILLYNDGKYITCIGKVLSVLNIFYIFFLQVNDSFQPKVKVLECSCR